MYLDAEQIRQFNGKGFFKDILTRDKNELSANTLS